MNNTTKFVKHYIMGLYIFAKNVNKFYLFFSKKIVRFFLVSLLSIHIHFIYAGLSAVTINSIQGSSPYLTFNNGVTKAKNTNELLGIVLSDGTQYNSITDTSLAKSPIELPNLEETLADVQMFVPVSSDSIDLKSLILSPYNYYGDDDGDGLGENGIKATGSLSLTITDANGNSVNRKDSLEACLSPYILTLKSSEGTLSTQYGYPNITNFDQSSATYYINPKIGSPYSCWATPNLVYTIDGYYDPNYTAWDPNKGFILQSLEKPSSNFPTTGFNQAWFNLTVAGALASSIVYDKSPATSGIDLVISGSGNIAKVLLTGPDMNSSATSAEKAVPTTFTLYSDTEKTNTIYTFTIGKWFIPKLGGVETYDQLQARCDSINYRVPGVTDYTNANRSLYGWTGGYPGQGNNYQRRIGGGLFAEWGWVDDTINKYPGSNFSLGVYRAVETYGENHYIISSATGNLDHAGNSARLAGSCVTP